MLRKEKRRQVLWRGQNRGGAASTGTALVNLEVGCVLHLHTKHLSLILCHRLIEEKNAQRNFLMVSLRLFATLQCRSESGSVVHSMQLVWVGANI